MVYPAIAIPSIKACGLYRNISRSLQVPGSPSSELQTMYFCPGVFRGIKLHFKPVGNPAPPLPLNADIFNSKGLLIKSYERNASLTKWVQTFLFFFYPFHPEKRKKEEIFVEFLHDIFKQIETEKILLN